MREISGFGGAYEETCKHMLLNGIEFMRTHPENKFRFKGFKDVFGLCISDNEDAKLLEDAIMKDIDNATGAMFQAVINHLLYIQANGWNKYKEMMDKP